MGNEMHGMRFRMQVGEGPIQQGDKSVLYVYFLGVLDGIGLFGPTRDAAEKWAGLRGMNIMVDGIRRDELDGFDAVMKLPDGRTVRYWSEGSW